MNNYVILFVGMVLGQMFTTSISVWLLQRKKTIDYKSAFKEFVVSEIASYVVTFVILCMAMFVLQDYIEPKKVAGMTESAWIRKLKIVENFRFYSMAFGAFSPLIGLLAFKKGLKAIEKKDKEISES